MYNTEISTPLGLLNRNDILVEVQGPKIGSFNREIDIWINQTLDRWQSYEFKKDLWGQTLFYLKEYHWLYFISFDPENCVFFRRVVVHFNDKEDAIIFKLLTSV